MKTFIKPILNDFKKRLGITLPKRGINHDLLDGTYSEMMAEELADRTRTFYVDKMINIAAIKNDVTFYLSPDKCLRNGNFTSFNGNKIKAGGDVLYYYIKKAYPDYSSLYFTTLFNTPPTEEEVELLKEYLDFDQEVEPCT